MSHRDDEPSLLDRIHGVSEELGNLRKPKEDPFAWSVTDVLLEMQETMLKKQADYGPNNIARAPGGPINGLRVRMFDKLSRISNLHESGAAAENEPLRDSFLDLACYGLIGLMVLDGTWPNLEDK
ncbi:MAG TPA: hypothetical protein VFH56_14275 [Acidimicrobiales bacterium]|nr:hypothetical protein [Acidimicrobiales bacterium]